MPYIDVMLVLLIIFMVTAPLLNLGVDVDLPKSKAHTLDQKKDPVVVKIESDGSYKLEARRTPTARQAIDVAERAGRARSARSTRRIPTRASISPPMVRSITRR